MASTTQLAIGEYLRTSYRPDREYVDGELVERNVGKYDHARIQALLAGWFLNHEKEWGIRVITEIRTRVSETRVRIPDVALIPPNRPAEVLEKPPVLAIEILSPEDSHAELLRRMADFEKMGVTAMWLIDPKRRSGSWWFEGKWTPAAVLEVPGTAIWCDLSELFRDLDQD